MTKIDFTRTSLLQELKKIKGWSIPYVTFWTWEKRGYIRPSSRIQDGKRTIPIYYHRDLSKIIAKIELFNRYGFIRLKQPKQNATPK